MAFREMGWTVLVAALAVTSASCAPLLEIAGPELKIDVKVDNVPPLTSARLPDGEYPLGSNVILDVSTLPDGSRALVVTDTVSLLGGSALQQALSELGPAGSAAIQSILLTVPTAAFRDPVTGAPVDLMALDSFTVAIEGTQVLDAAQMNTLSSTGPVSVPLGQVALQQVRQELDARQPVAFDMKVTAIVPPALLTGGLPSDIEMALALDTEIQVLP